MVTALQTLVTRRFDPFDPVVLTVGAFHAGTKLNVIPDTARFEATVRAFSQQSQARIRDGAITLVRSIAAAHGLEIEVEYEHGYPLTVTDADETEFTRQTIAEVFGEERFQRLEAPLTASEDFSRVLEEVPGGFVMFGACPPDADPTAAPYNHSPLAVYDDRVIADGAALYAELATRRLAASAA
jgi:hippurate hydrolase